MVIDATLREKVKGWGGWPGVVLVMWQKRVVDTVRCEQAGKVLYTLRYYPNEFDDLWLKTAPIEKLAQVEAGYRDQYGLAPRLTKK